MQRKVSEEAQRAIELECRSHKLRIALLSTPGLLESLHEAREAIRRGEGLTLEQLDRELAEMD